MGAGSGLAGDGGWLHWLHWLHWLNWLNVAAIILLTVTDFYIADPFFTRVTDSARASSWAGSGSCTDLRGAGRRADDRQRQVVHGPSVRVPDPRTLTAAVG